MVRLCDCCDCCLCAVGCAWCFPCVGCFCQQRPPKDAEYWMDCSTIDGNVLKAVLEVRSETKLSCFCDACANGIVGATRFHCCDLTRTGR